MTGRALCFYGSAAVVAVSCSFPEIDIAETVASSSAGGSPASSSSATTSSSAGGIAGSTASSGGDPCANPDKDGDMQDAVECGGTDCNDDNPDAYFGQSGFFDVPMAGMPEELRFDYNCSGVHEIDPEHLSAGCALLTCNQHGYVEGAAQCGQQDGWVRCQVLMNLCSAVAEAPPSDVGALKCH